MEWIKPDRREGGRLLFGVIEKKKTGDEEKRDVVRSAGIFRKGGCKKRRISIWLGAGAGEKTGAFHLHGGCHGGGYSA